MQFTMADLGYRFPDYPVPPGETQATFLRKIAEVGARERYRPYADRARAQITRELDLIEKLNLAGYFLIVWDIVNFCRQHDILVQGRGSAANSAVCYSLGITAVDPVGMDLLFERFLSEERGEWPDIDLDLPSGDRRERVIQHVYEKYGRLGAAMTANVITYRGRSAAREVGKALGFEPLQIDRLAKVMNNFEFTDPADTLPRHLSAVGLDLHSDRVRLFARLWGEMQDLPRHLGQHSGGMVICQGQLDAVVPLENASMPGRVVVQWDKDDCADMGIVKVDLLGLGMMAVLQDAIALVNRTQHPAPSTQHARSGTSPAERPGRLRDAPGRRHDRRLPGRIARADGDAAAPQTRVFLRHRRPGGHHSSWPDRRADGASVSQPARRPGARPVSASVARADSRAHARRAVVPGAVAAHGDGGRRVQRRTSRRAAARVRLQTVGAANEADRGAVARRHGASGDWRRGGGADRLVHHVVCACTDFPSRTRRALPCWRMRARFSRRTIRRRSIRRCSTISRWGSTIRRRSSRTRSAAAYGSIPSTCRSPAGTAPSRQMAPSGSDCGTCRGCESRLEERLRPRARTAIMAQGLAPACPKCGCDDESMLEATGDGGLFCNVCSHHAPARPPRAAPLRVG